MSKEKGKKKSEKRLTALTFQLIDEGRFLESLNEELLELAKELIAHCAKYGLEAKNATAKLVVGVVLAANPDDELAFTVRGESKRVPPVVPAVTTSVVQDGQSLSVRPSGSTQDSPHQSIMFGPEGKPLDQKPGKRDKKVKK